MDYFVDSIDYPKDVGGTILPINTCWNYISSTFLNGFINYVDIIKAYVIGRYTEWDEEIEGVNIQDPPNSFNWVEFSGTKEQVYNKVTEEGRLFHTDISMLQDDVLILAKAKGSDIYYFFWFDMDCSDCNIGRFKTDDTENEVIEAFSKHVSSCYIDNPYGEKELSLHCFKGWISF